MTVRQYIETNFTDVEKSLFEYLINSFPESLLVINNQESEDTLSLLATLAKVIGSSKELILNLKTGHSIEEVFNKIENGYLVDNNKNLLLPLAADLNYHRLSDEIETEELIDRLIEEKPFVLDYYNLYKNRGTLTAITQIVKKFAVFLNSDDLPFNVYEFDTEMDIILENVGQIEKFGDFTQGDFNLTINEELVEVVPIRKDNILFDMLMQIKPLGFTYNVLLKYLSSIILNLQDDRIVGKDGRVSLIEPQVFASQQLLSTTLPIIEDLTINQQAFIDGTSEAKDYVVDIKNISTAVSLEAYVADWVNAGQLSSASRFEDLLYRTVQEQFTSLSYSQDTANRQNAIFDTKSSLDNYINSVQPTSGRFLVTGFRWDLTTLAAFNAATNAITVTDTVTTGNAPDRFDMEVRTPPLLAVRNQYPSGDIVVRFIRTVTSANETLTRYFRLVTVTTGGFPGAPTSTGVSAGVGSFLIAGFKGFSFEKYIISPNAVRTIERTSTDLTYAGSAQFIGVYFTNVNRPLEKTPNLVAPFNNPQQVNIVASPISLSFKPKLNTTLAKQEDALQPLPQATLVPNSISKTSSVISGVLTNNNTNNITNVNTQIRLLNNSTGIFGAWQTLATSSVFRNNIAFSFSGLSANTQHTFQTRNTTGTAGFEPTSAVNQYQETTQMAQQLSPPVFVQQGLEIGETAFTVTYSNPNNVSATLNVAILETQDVQEVTILPFSSPGSPTVSVTFANGQDFQIDPDTEYTVSAKLIAAGFTTSQTVENVIKTEGGEEPTPDPVVTTTPTLTALQVAGPSSISFTLNNQQQESVKFAWEVRSTDGLDTIITSQGFTGSFRTTNENFIVEGLDPETTYKVRGKALAEGNFTESAFTAYQERTTQASGVEQTSAPTTSVVGQTATSVTFRIVNTEDDNLVTLQYEIATAQTGGTVIKSGSNISVNSVNVAGGDGSDGINVSANAADGIESDTEYFLREVFAKAGVKSLSNAATVRSTTTPLPTITATFDTLSGTPSTYTAQTGEGSVSVTKPTPDPVKTGFTFTDNWLPSIPVTITENTLFTPIYRLLAPQINTTSGLANIVVDGNTITFNYRNSNLGGHENVITQVRIATQDPNDEKGAWVNIANFGTNQTNLTHTLSTYANGDPLELSKTYTVLLRNISSPANNNVITSPESSFVRTTQGIVRAKLITDEAVSGINVQWEIDGPNSYDESGTAALGSASFTQLVSNMPSGATIAINAPTSFVFNSKTHNLQFLGTTNGTIDDFNVPNGGQYTITDITFNPDITLTYFLEGSSGGGSGGGTGGGGSGPGEVLE